MIDCEYRCIKGKGNNADCRIRIKSQNKDINICYHCLENFHPIEFEILEYYNKNQIVIQNKDKQISLYPKKLPELHEKLQRIFKPFNKDDLFQK